MPCHFCDMGICINPAHGVVKLYSLEEDLASRYRPPEPEPQRMLLFDISRSSTERSQLSALSLPEPSSERRRGIITTPEEARNAARIAEASTLRRRITETLREANEALDEVSVTNVYQDLNDLLSKVGQLHPRPEAEFAELKQRRNLFHENVETIEERKKAVQQDFTAAKPFEPGPLSKILERAQNTLSSASGMSALFDSITLDAITLLKSRTASSSSSSAGADITATGATRPAVLASSFPIVIGNALRVASDMINNPTTGPTGFTVRTSAVYHSSAGSSRAGSSKGTAFWIVSSGTRILIAMGEHATNQTNVYKINWTAPKVRVTSTRVNYVTLQTANRLESF